MNTKKTFLMRLKFFMSCRFRLREIRDTLDDFNGFFEEGIREGKTEGELCLSFGSPREIVRQMSAGKRRISLHMLLALLAAAVCGACLWRMAASPYALKAPSFFFCIPVLAAGAALLFADGGILFQMEPPETFSFRRPALWRLASLVLAGSLLLFCQKGPQWIAASAEPSAAGPLAGGACHLFAACGAALALYSAYAFFHGHPASFGLALLGMGVLCSSYAMQDFLHRLDALTSSPSYPLFPCVLGIFLSLLCDGALLAFTGKNLSVFRHTKRRG